MYKADAKLYRHWTEEWKVGTKVAPAELRKFLDDNGSNGDYASQYIWHIRQYMGCKFKREKDGRIVTAYIMTFAPKKVPANVLEREQKEAAKAAAKAEKEAKRADREAKRAAKSSETPAPAPEKKASKKSTKKAPAKAKKTEAPAAETAPEQPAETAPEPEVIASESETVTAALGALETA